jgi:hypothetical protein
MQSQGSVAATEVVPDVSNVILVVVYLVPLFWIVILAYWAIFEHLFADQRWWHFWQLEIIRMAIDSHILDSFSWSKWMCQ